MNPKDWNRPFPAIYTETTNFNKFTNEIEFQMKFHTLIDYPENSCMMHYILAFII